LHFHRTGGGTLPLGPPARFASRGVREGRAINIIDPGRRTISRGVDIIKESTHLRKMASVRGRVPSPENSKKERQFSRKETPDQIKKMIDKGEKGSHWDLM